MSRLRLWSPRLLLTWQPLWLLVQAAQPLGWAQAPVQLTSDPPGLTEPWSSHSSDLPPELPHALTPLAEPGGFNYLTSSSPDHLLALPHEDLSETLVPYLDSDSAGELLAEPDKFAILHEDLDDKLTQHQKLPEAVPVLDWDQNQALVLPPQHKSKAKTIGLDQAENHQSFEILVPPLGSKSSKPTKFIVSPSNLKKDLVKHRPLAKVVVGTTRQLGKKNQGLEELQDDYLDSSMDAFYPEESLPTDFLGSPDETPEPPEAEISSSQLEYHTSRPLPTELFESSSQREMPEEAESFSSEEEAQAQHLEHTNEVELPLLQQEALSQPAEAPKEVETSSPQEALAQPLEAPKETVARPAAHHTVQQSHLHNVTVKPLDLVLTVTPEVTKEVEPSPVQLGVLSQPPEHFEEVEPLPAQEEAPSEFPEQQDVVETPPVQPEALSQPAKHPETVASPLLHQETPTQAPGFPTEYVFQVPMSDEVVVRPGIRHQVHSNLHNVAFQPHDLGLTITPTLIKKTKFPATQQKPPETLGEAELSSEQEQPAQPSELTGEDEAFPTQQETTGQAPEETEPSSSEQEQLTQPSEPTGEVEPSLTQQETLTQLNFQGNYISYIDENIWKAYRWAEKLILSENSLTELHKDSFEGLLSLQYLDLSCNKIQSIERRSFEPLPFLQFINLGCNLLTELSFGTFQAWHGMQFLHKLILNRNPLTSVEDSYLFKLPALKYLDMGTTQVSLTTIESILMMTLELEKLILPIRMACCLCQFKDTIEVVCKTIKLHCDSDCLTNITFCDENTSIGNAEGSFMKVLQARKKNTSTELTIEPERASSDISAVSDQFESQLNQQLRSLIPNNDVRKLIAHVIRTLKMDCSETHVQLACAKLISRTGLLMKLLSEQQEIKVSKAEWDTDQWKTENYINESTEAQSEQKEQESNELTKEVPGYGYNNKLILAISVTVVVMFLIIMFCLIE
ncbi:hypothetical protein FD754_009793, partial [Muntiacus muntjak]